MIGIEIRYGYHEETPGNYRSLVQVIDHTSDNEDRWVHAPATVTNTETAMELASTMAHSIMEMLRLFGAVDGFTDVSLN